MENEENNYKKLYKDERLNPKDKQVYLALVFHEENKKIKKIHKYQRIDGLDTLNTLDAWDSIKKLDKLGYIIFRYNENKTIYYEIIK